MKQLIARKTILGLAIAAGFALALWAPGGAAGGLLGADGEIDCEKQVDTLATGAVVEPQTDVTFDVLCTVTSIPITGTVATEPLDIVDVVFENFTISTATCDAGDDTGFIDSDPATIDGQEVSCTFIPDIDRTEFRLRIVGQFTDGPCGDYTNSALATYDEDTETPSVDFFLECEDLSADKVVSSVIDSTGATVEQGGSLSYDVTICNDAAGGGDADSVEVVDQLPAGLESVTVTSDDFELAEGSAGEIIATLDLLAPGDCASFSVEATVATDTACGFVLTNVVAAVSTSGNTFDADLEDNIDSVSTTVACPSDDSGGTDDGSGPIVGTGNSGLAGTADVGARQVMLLVVSLVVTGGMAAVAFRRIG
ncbi:MAG: hypothetical protein WEB00_08160 [Dehalococcoidia bacterium]